MLPKPSKRPRIDSHFHVFAAGESRPGARYVPGYDATFESWRAAAVAVGVERGVLVQPSFLGTDNTRLCEELRRHAGILRGIAVIAPTSTAALLRDLHAAGVRGMRFNLSGGSHHLHAWGGTAGIWDELLRLGWHLEIHADAGALPRVLPQLPASLSLVIDHMARPATASAQDPTIAMLRARARTSPIHVKLSGAYRLPGIDAGAVARVLRDELGPSRLLWGSDWPCTNHEAFADYPRLLAALFEWIGDSDAELASGANPAALYWGGESSK
jgi:predicted TIM-barrel fold metal-dependent hydrolase